MLFFELILVKHTTRHVVMHWARRFGGPGLVLFAIGDSSIIPTFGSLDALLVFFAARSPQDWPYYALMALIGSIIGGYMTYRMGLHGGKAALEKRFSEKSLGKIYRWTEHHSFWAVSVPAFLPPPTPLSPFLLAAGATNVSRKKFLPAYSGARAARYALVGWLASKYGHSVLRWLAPYEKPLLLAFITIGLIGTPLLIWLWRRKSKKPTQERQEEKSRPKAA